jgi:hypothetical protein
MLDLICTINTSDKKYSTTPYYTLFLLSKAQKGALITHTSCVSRMGKSDGWIYLEHSCNVAGSKDPLHAGISLGIRGREVGGEDAVLGALPALVLARGAALARHGGCFRVGARRHDLAEDFL